MQNINIKNSQDAIKAYSDSANAYSGTKMKTASVDQLDAFEKVGQVQYDRNSSVDTNAQTVMDNFNEYRKDMQEKAKQEQQEETSDEEQARADAREIARSLTSEEIKKLRMMGVDVASASLSDIEGLVTSMRADARKDALVNVLAQAQIEEGDASNLVFTSSGAQIAGTDVKLQVGNKDILYLLKNRQPLTQDKERLPRWMNWEETPHMRRNRLHNRQYPGRSRALDNRCMLRVKMEMQIPACRRSSHM